MESHQKIHTGYFPNEIKGLEQVYPIMAVDGTVGANAGCVEYSNHSFDRPGDKPRVTAREFPPVLRD